MTTRISNPKHIHYVRQTALSVGFDSCAITHASKLDDLRPRLERFVALGRHGTMRWMEETMDRRGHPRALWPQTGAIIMVGLSYAPASDPMETLGQRNVGTISVYARNRDYHDVIKGRLKTLASKIVSKLGGGVKVFVDTAPVMEKPLAQAAGLGWQGKHTNLVSRTHGSWLFLGALFTTLDLADDRAEQDHCGSCTRCLDICPTRAFPAPYQLDARRCISYLTIEHKGPIPQEFRKAIGNRIYGCDDCLAVCPWNKFADEARDAKLQARDDLNAPQLIDLLRLDDAAFRKFFSGSPIKRIGRDRFIRNCLIAAGNSQNAALITPVRALLSDASPLVRGAAIWAMGELTPHTLEPNSDEEDEHVLAEWDAYCGS